MINQVTIQGRMTKDTEDKMLNNGKVLSTFCVAVQRNYKNAEGKYDADFIDCVAYDKTGEFIGKYFHKGDMILLTGELSVKVYEDSNGVKHKGCAVRVGSVYFPGDKKQATNRTAENNGNAGELPFEM